MTQARLNRLAKADGYDTAGERVRFHYRTDCGWVLDAAGSFAHPIGGGNHTDDPEVALVAIEKRLGLNARAL